MWISFCWSLIGATPLSTWSDEIVVVVVVGVDESTHSWINGEENLLAFVLQSDESSFSADVIESAETRVREVTTRAGAFLVVHGQTRTQHLLLQDRRLVVSGRQQSKVIQEKAETFKSNSFNFKFQIC